jgi:hypothetical protein
VLLAFFFSRTLAVSGRIALLEGVFPRSMLKGGLKGFISTQTERRIE